MKVNIYFMKNMKEVEYINSGKIFEQEIKESIPKDVYYFRIKDPAQSFGEKSNNTRFSPKNEFDAFIYKNSILIAAELKSNSGSSISFSKDPTIKKEINFNQIESLRVASTFNIRAGLLMNFRRNNKTYWIDILNFIEFATATEKCSINEKDIIAYNGLVIPQVKKRVKYRYDLSVLWEQKERIDNNV